MAFSLLPQQRGMIRRNINGHESLYKQPNNGNSRGKRVKFWKIHLTFQTQVLTASDLGNGYKKEAYSGSDLYKGLKRLCLKTDTNGQNPHPRGMYNGS